MNNVIIVPSKPEGLKFFLNNCYWENLRVNVNKIPTLEYIAIYESFPICKITHYGKIIKIEEYNCVTRFVMKSCDMLKVA